MSAPNQLPSFDNPPLSEVVLDVQFTRAPHYKLVHAQEIWNLFKTEFPRVEERIILPPQFETFGDVGTESETQISVGEPPIGGRLCFISGDESHVLQYQPDRLIANWRKLETGPIYPRFESIVDAFKANLEKIARYFTTEFSYEIDINQAEITYINVIKVDTFSELGAWFKPWNTKFPVVSGINLLFSEIVQDSSGEPCARLHQHVQSLVRKTGNHDKAFRLSLKYKGKPPRNDIDATIGFIRSGHDAIVNRFCHITTEDAHKIWEKKT